MLRFKHFLTESTTKLVGNVDAHKARIHKIISGAYSKPEYHEDEHGNKVRKWKEGESHTDEDVHHWLKGNRVIEDLHSGLEHVRPQHIHKMVADGHLKKDPHANYHWVTKEAAERYHLPKVMGKEFPRASQIGEKPKATEGENKNTVHVVAKHDASHVNQEHEFKHSLAKIKANKLKEPIHVVHNTKSGNVESVRKSVFDSYKNNSHYKILKTHKPEK